MPTNEKKRRANLREVLILSVILLALGFGAVFYLSSDSGHPTVTAVFKLASGKSSEYQLELAANDASRRKGLMFRKSMASDRGMIFVFPDEQVRSFWMKDTFIPLDMLFLNAERRVVGILKDVPPFSESSRRVESKAKYVVELNAGTAEKEKISDGAQLEIVSGALPEAR